MGIKSTFSFTFVPLSNTKKPSKLIPPQSLAMRWFSIIATANQTPIYSGMNAKKALIGRLCGTPILGAYTEWTRVGWLSEAT